VTELSCTPSRVAEVKAAVRELTFAQCRDVAAHALALDSAAAVRAHLVETFPALAGRDQEVAA
jgi:phosphoenolpyruvate-protein kinase (PTS system EI component)